MSGGGSDTFCVQEWSTRSSAVARHRQLTLPQCWSTKTAVGREHWAVKTWRCSPVCRPPLTLNRSPLPRHRRTEDGELWPARCRFIVHAHCAPVLSASLLTTPSARQPLRPLLHHRHRSLALLASGCRVLGVEWRLPVHSSQSHQRVRQGQIHVQVMTVMWQVVAQTTASWFLSLFCCIGFE